MHIWPNRSGRAFVHGGIERIAPVRPQQDIRNLFSNRKMSMRVTPPLLGVHVHVHVLVCVIERKR